MRVFPFMAVLGTLLRWRRGESLVLAALLLACLCLPGAVHGAVLPPQNAQAVLLWLSSELAPDVTTATPQFKRECTLLALQNRDNASVYYSSVAAPPLGSAPDEARLAKLQIERRAPFIPSLETHEAAFLTGVRSNRRRN